MPFTRAWDETAPADSTLSNLLGQDIRQFKQDVRERMTNAVFVDFTTDPLVVQPRLLGNANKTITMTQHQFEPSNVNAQDTFVRQTLGCFFTTSNFGAHTSDIIAWIPLPLGVTLVSFYTVYSQFEANGVTARLCKINNFLTAPAEVILATVQNATTGSIIAPGTTVTDTTTEAVPYYFRISLTQTATPTNDVFYGAHISYNTPDCRNTL